MKKIVTIAAAAGIVGLVLAPVSHAALTANSTLSQTITAGTLSTDIRNASGSPVSNPTFSLGATSVSTNAQTATGKFGNNTNRITVDNPGGANNGWTLTLNATTPGTAKWTDGGKNYAYNGTATTGQLTVDPSAGTLQSEVGSSTGITKGSSATFSGSTPITLLTAAANSDDIWRGHLTDVDLSQKIPASQAAGTYTLNLTQTVAAV
ncbi:MAG: hypothetical protein Q4A34_02530 [Candidatus Saccharibacteria bacterium]|nr:hypothetical protein [Candidatus Saccharibacteria bacterium]